VELASERVFSAGNFPVHLLLNPLSVFFFPSLLASILVPIPTHFRSPIIPPPFCSTTKISTFIKIIPFNEANRNLGSSSNEYLDDIKTQAAALSCDLTLTLVSF